MQDWFKSLFRFDRINDFSICFREFSSICLVLLAAYRRSLYFFEKKLLLYFGSITRIYPSIFKEELIFTVEELRVIFFLNESHFRLSCCFSFFNLTIFLYNLSSLHLFFSGSLASFWELQRYHHRRKISVSIDCCITFVVFMDFLNHCFLLSS